MEILTQSIYSAVGQQQKGDRNHLDSLDVAVLAENEHGL
jgi:hypothetical protein